MEGVSGQIGDVWNLDDLQAVALIVDDDGGVMCLLLRRRVVR